MKEVLVVLAMTMCCLVSSEGPNFVHMNENDTIGTPYGTFEFDYCSHFYWNVTNFPNIFQVDQTDGRNLSVSLKKNFSREDFNKDSTTDCSKKAQAIFIDVFCSTPPSKSIELNVISFTLNDTSAPYLCYSNCSKIENPYTIEILEDTAPNTNVTPPLMICDDDIVYGNTQNQHSVTTTPNDVIEYTTNGVQLKTNLDYETKTSFNANIIIEAGGSSNQSALHVKVIVKDVDDLGLAFDDRHIIYECSIPENQNGNVPNCTVNAKDLDKDVNTNVEYALVSESPTANGVLVDKTSGVITVTKTLDRESVPVIVLYIKGYQVDRPLDKVNYTTVILKVTDVDDHAPTMQESNISINITENIPIGTNVYQATAVDKYDQGENAMFVYNMKDSSRLFELNSSTGLVTTKMEIDKENITTTSVTLEIKAVSKMNSSLTSNNLIVHITILDENDNSPVFQTDGTDNSTDVKISKTQKLNVCIVTINATDKDTGENGVVKYRIEQDVDVFSINSDNGCIKLKKNLSEKFSFLYRLVIQAEDQAKQFKRSSIMILRVHVQDENTHPPVFVDLPTSMNISEAIPPKTILLELKAEDRDPTDNLTFILKSHKDVFLISHSRCLNNLQYVTVGTGNNFTALIVDRNCIISCTVISGRSNTIVTVNTVTTANFTVVRTIGSLDRENVSSYNIILAVSDSIHEVNRTVQILVENVNDNTPLFVNQSYRFEVNETTDEDSIEKNVGRVQASDKDLDDVTYSIDQNSIWINNVSINSNTGIISIHQLDRDVMGKNPVIQFSVLAVDNGEPPRTGSAMVDITVIGVNDNAPHYLTRSVVLYLTEGRHGHVYTSKAVDADIGVGSEIRYAVKEDKTGEFDIDATSGSMTLNHALSIRSLNTSRVLIRIEAYNNVNGTRNATQTVSVHIQGVNHNKPIFNLTHYTKEVSECTMTNAFILRVHATDADTTKEYNTVYYWMEEGNSDSFYVNPLTGAIHLVGDIDYDESVREIHLTVYATDDIASKDTSIHTNVTLTITDCNDNPPIFTQSMYLCHISEGETGNFSCEVHATDVDASNKIQYSITHLPQYYQNFLIDNQSGVLSVKPKSAFDFESMESDPVFLNVSASDGNFTRYAAVVVTILDVNDEPPVFQNTPYEFVTAENMETLPHYIGFINVTDADSARNLSIVNCSESSSKNPFLIKNSGEVFSNEQLDYELRTMYVCTIQASDSEQIRYANVTILVQDVNDNSPTFKNNYRLSLNETFATNKKFITVNATDEDKSANNNIVTYSIFAGDVLKMFSINNSTGDIKLDKSLEKFGGHIFELKIKATDNGDPPLTGYTTVTVTVVATNNNPPKFVRTPYHALIYENAGNQSVLQVSAEDSDGTENLKFSVANNTNDFYFSDNGILFANNLDAEKYNRSDGVCYVLVTVSDGVNVDNTTAVITIIDENDNYPAFDQKEYRKAINDTTNVQTEILTVVASDGDITNHGFTFMLRDSKGDFDINSTTGQISLLRPLGQNGRQYEMIVEVIDSGNPPKHNETNIIIAINDTNNPPTFDSNVTNQTVNENDNSLSLSFAADDTDIGQAGNVTYSITSSNNDLNIFRFDSTTASLTLANTSCPLDFEEQPIFHFTIIAKDHGAFTKYACANVTIYVKDINEAPYFIGCCDRIVYVELNTPINTQVLSVTVFDPDVNNESYNKLTYSLEGNDIESKFEVRNNGTVYSKTIIDKSGNYSFNLTTKDNGNLTDTEPFTIVVPRIENSTKCIHVSENDDHMNLTQLDRIVDGYEVYYEINPSPHSGKFTIDTNMYLILTHAFDKETTARTFLWIYGRSVHHDILLANVTVNIEIDDVNDCAPVFQSDKYIFIVDDVMEKDTLVGEVFAVDRDVEPRNQNITYSLIDDEHGYFHIEKTGEIFLGNISSIECQNFTLHATAEDGTFVTNATVVIRVLDTNNHSPQFIKYEYEFEMVESNCTDAPCDVGTALATDRDLNNNGNILYTIIAGSHSSFAIILQADGSGLIQAVANIDREQNEQFTLTVCASDMGHRPRQSCIPVTINVLDVNDNTPKFHGADYYIGSVVENSAVGSKVEVVPGIVALDIDKGDNGTEGLTYNLNVTDGPICISNQYPVSVIICGSIDRETQNIYYLSVEVYDIGNKSASLPLIVHIEDENDESPVFTESLYRFNVTENANASEYVGTISVTDRDLNGTDDITYRINNDDASPIYIDGITGALYVGGKIDREKDLKFVLNISAFDGKNFNYTTAEIVVKDVNDNAPDFGIPEKEIITINVSENVEYGVILNITVEDKDEEGSINSEIIFKLSGDVIAAPSDSHTLACNASSVAVSDDSCLFTITQTGQLNLTRTLDREVQDHYSLTVTVSDKGTTPLSSSMTVYINVLDENDNDPVFIVDGMTGGNYSESYTVEKIPENSVMKLIDTNDVDFGINGTVTYSIVESPFSKYFKIGNSSGVVSIAQAISVNTLLNIPSVGEGILDLNGTAILNLTIIATDGGGRESNMTLSVFIEPLNDDDAPVFEEMVFNFKIPENEASGSYVGTCVARIINETYSHMNYILIGGYEHTKNDFMIDSKTGIITTSISLDRESVAQYTFAVKVRDGRIPERTAFAEVEIQVSDVNDNSPVFHSNDVNVEISENSLPRVLNASAKDRDLGQNGSITYSLVNDYGGLFIINSTNGLLNASGPFDFEDVNQYIVEIVASDFGLPHQRNSSIFVNVSITDENDNSPHFKDTITSLDIKENSPPHKLFSVSATDEDSGWNGDIIYELIDKELTPFVINAFSGDVYLRGHLDFERRSNYTLTIQAKDQGEPPLCVNKTVDVNVIDIYDDIPKFENDMYEVTLPSKMAVAGASVIELDVGVADVNFVISGQDATYFKEVGHNLTLSENLNTDRNLFAVTVTAKDKVNQTTSCSVIVHTRGHIILFPNKEFPVNVAENLETGSILVDLNTTEEFLPGPGIIYSIDSVIPSGSEAFSVDRSTGVVRCNKALDRETVSQYIITISARSAETRRKRDVPDFSSITRIIVNVTDVNDNPPKFPESQPRVFGVPDNVRANYIVATLQAFDPDVNGAANIRYNITGGRSDVFGVDQRKGNIITLVAIATVKDKLLNLVVTAYDDEKKEDRVDIDVFVNVVPTENQPYLILDKSVANFIARKDELIKNMSRILGVEIQSDKIEGHLSSDGDNMIHVDLSKTDFYFHGFINSSGNYSLVSNKDMESLLQNASKQLASIFGNIPEIGQYHESQDPIYDPSAITSTQIILICMAVFIFFGTGSALFIAHYSWSRYDIDCKMDEVKKEDREGSEIELNTLRSRQSSKKSSTTAAAATNPTYQETELTGNENVNNQSYESQEIRLQFSEEIRSNSNFGSPGGIDSGLANTSVHSSTNHTLASSDTPLSPAVDEHARLVDGLEVLSEHGPAMTSSPRPSRNLIVGGVPSPSDEQEAKQPTESNILILNTTGVTETDDEIDDKDDPPENVIDASADPEDTDLGVGNVDMDANNIDSGASNVDTGAGNVDMENEDITDHDDQTNGVDSVTETTSF